jgi:DNA-binding HxlR family transcriptional regulator
MKDFKYDGRLYYNTVELALAFVGGTWKPAILLALAKGPLRYKDLRKNVAHISDRMLFTHLRDLEKKEMLTRTIYKEKPPRVEYKLTSLGKKGVKLVRTIGKFGDGIIR